jgi:hypothetical protein
MAAKGSGSRKGHNKKKDNNNYIGRAEGSKGATIRKTVTIMVGEGSGGATVKKTITIMLANWSGRGDHNHYIG